MDIGHIYNGYGNGWRRWGMIGDHSILLSNWRQFHPQVTSQFIQLVQQPTYRNMKLETLRQYQSINVAAALADVGECGAAGVCEGLGQGEVVGLQPGAPHAPQPLHRGQVLSTSGMVDGTTCDEGLLTSSLTLDRGHAAHRHQGPAQRLQGEVRPVTVFSVTELVTCDSNV